MEVICVSFTDKKLAQTILNNTVSAIVTPGAGAKNYLTQIYLTNNSLTIEGYVTIYAYGATKSNMLFPKIKIEPEGHISLLETGETIPLLTIDESLYAKADIANNVVITVIGSEVV